MHNSAFILQHLKNFHIFVCKIVFIGKRLFLTLPKDPN